MTAKKSSVEPSGIPRSASGGRGSVATVVVPFEAGTGSAGALSVPGSIASMTVHVTGLTLGRYSNLVAIVGSAVVGWPLVKETALHRVV